MKCKRLLALALASLIAMLLMLRGQEGISLFLSLYTMLVPAPLVLGIAVSLWLLRRRA